MQHTTRSCFHTDVTTQRLCMSTIMHRVKSVRAHLQQSTHARTPFPAHPSASLLSVQQHMWPLQKPFVFGTLLYSSPPPTGEQTGFIARWSRGNPQRHAHTHTHTHTQIHAFPQCHPSVIHTYTHILLQKCEFQHLR